MFESGFINEVLIVVIELVLKFLFLLFCFFIEVMSFIMKLLICMVVLN